MACDLSDSAISQAYKNILDGTTSWLVIGYRDTRDKLFLYEEGTGDVEEFREKFNEPVLYGLLRSLDHLIYVTYVDEQISGVRRARAVVHGRSVGALFEQQDVHMNITKSSELTQQAIEKLLTGKSTDSPTKPLNTPDSSVPSTPKKRSQEQIPKKESFTSPKNPPQPTVALPEVPKPGTPEPAPKPRVDTPPTPAVPPKPKQPTPEPAAKLQVENSPAKPSSQATSPINDLAAVLTSQTATNTTILQSPSEAKLNFRSVNNSEGPISPISDGRQTPNSKEKVVDNLSEENKTKIQDAIKKRESVKLQFEKAENKGDPTQLSGYITVQGGGCFFWKRRWFVLRGGSIYFYRDPQDQFPVSCIDLEKHKIELKESWEETLIPNSFKVELDRKDCYFFFSDDNKQKELAMAGIIECSSD